MNEPVIAGMTKVPYGIEIPGMEYMFAGFLKAAIGDADVRARFEKETGRRLDSLVRRSPLDAMIDRATGKEAEMIAAFADWATETLWGVQDLRGVAAP